MEIYISLPHTKHIQSFFLIILFLLVGCSDDKPEINYNQGTIAIVGDREITQEDFIRRAEYTPRPNYCRSDNPLHKKIVLNSLIAEKLFSIDPSKTLRSNNALSAYIKGRTEQAMRQLLYHNKAYSQAKVSDNEIKKIYNLSQRSYFLEINHKSDSGQADSLFTVQIEWEEDKIPELHHILYKTGVEKDDIIDSIYFNNKEISMKVLGWTNKVSFSQIEVEKRKNEVIDYLRDIKAQEIYTEYIAELMKGKEIRFNEETFYELSNKARDLYLSTEENKLNALNKALWNLNKEISEVNPATKQSDIKQNVLFNIDNIDWTVKDFLELIQSHPLVFRKRSMGKGEFPEQFKLAIVDLVRDHYINTEAYKLGLDKSRAVILNKELWEDFFFAQATRDSILKLNNLFNSFVEDQFNTIQLILDPIVDSLQAEFSDKIFINIDLFEETDLTRVDMMATQRNVPYPVIVPNFPILTTDHKLDYGRKLD